jgi:alginate O-acetyltransferase complex protein AlgI
MLFLTYWYVAFMAVAFPLYWAVRHPRARPLVLLASCAVFHTHFAGPAGVLPIAVLAVVTYFAGLSRRRLLCQGGICLSVAALIFYKYFKFLCTEVVGAFAPSWKAAILSHPVLTPAAPPLAISFFVFEFVHYLADVGRGYPAIRNPLKFALYSIFWPSIVAGPVKRYQDFLPALKRGTRHVGSQDVAVGLTRVALGLVKKFAADTLTAWVAFWGPHFNTWDPLWRWAFVAALGLRIVWDFSGYSDMAIGFARMHGITLPENFNWPYLATSVTDFWHRWHISLSTWIRDYVYISLGGGRCGLARKVANGLLAFGICGLWHGAGWNFLVWGVYHGAGLAVASNYRRALGPVGEALAHRLAAHPPVGWVMTLVFVGVGWVFFFYPLGQALSMVKLLFGV